MEFERTKGGKDIAQDEVAAKVDQDIAEAVEDVAYEERRRKARLAAFYDG